VGAKVDPVSKGHEDLEAEDEKTLTEKNDEQFTIAITRSKYS